PRIGMPFREYFKRSLDGMVAPHAPVQPLSWRVRSAGWADFGMRGHSVSAVEPAVGSPHKRAEGVMGVLITPAIKDYLRRTSRLGFAVCARNEKQMRRCANPH